MVDYGAGVGLDTIKMELEPGVKSLCAVVLDQVTYRR